MDIDAWVWWLIGAAALGIPLVMTAMPEFGMLAVGAVAAAVTAGLGGDVVLQVVVFAVVSVALIAVVRPIAARHRSQRPELVSGVEALKGRSAVVLERVDANGGRIKLAGEIWSARPLDNEQSYEAGQEVDVVEIDGATAVVI
ncbi:MULTISPECIES: NfeD family protein [Streptomyces]|uniref:NfeD-like C-terminal domain-containing protein n=2 Tax=Streptomyces TaxID=1883 RepID=A0A0W7WT18_9ACTN|nr:NfeD family protein [Streptomyces silvensis]KUF13725.1 hypothetical protein AT728_00040 [Streptomyces silvensis]MVO86790.1 NfeD family protein [Streptomyces typhae]